MASNKHKGKWRKKIVKTGSHRHRSRGKPNRELPFFQTALLIVLFAIIGFVGFNFILHLIEMIY